MDNDVFTSLIRDQYYTSGLFGVFRKLKRIGNDSTYLVRSYTFLQRLYTPKKLSWDDTREFDRPYAGQISVQGANEYYTPSKRYLKVQMEIGIMGPASLSQPIHESWHTVLSLPYPEGWDYQIGNTPIVNFYFTHAKSVVNHPTLDLVTESNLALGTVYNNIRQEFMLRMGMLRPLHESVHFNGLLGRSNYPGKPRRLQEYYFFFSPGLEMNMYNSTIDGRLIGGNDLHTEQSETIIYQNKVGLMLSWTRIDTQIFHYWRSPETAEANPHVYVGWHLNYRF